MLGSTATKLRVLQEHLATVTKHAKAKSAKAHSEKAVASKSDRSTVMFSMGLRHHLLAEPARTNRLSGGIGSTTGQPGRRLAIISQPRTSQAEKKTLVVAAVRTISKMTNNGHHTVLEPADIPADAIVEDRYVDLSTREVHGCVSLQSKGRKSFELQYYAWMAWMQAFVYGS